MAKAISVTKWSLFDVIFASKVLLIAICSQIYLPLVEVVVTIQKTEGSCSLVESFLQQK